MVACTTANDSGDSCDSSADCVPTDQFPQMETAACEAPAYEWVSLDAMGEVTDWEEMDDLSLSADSIEFMLQLAGITNFSPIPYGIKTYRVRYTTQDRGALVEATAVISYPDVEQASSFPVVMFAHGTTGFTDACAPGAGGIEELAVPVLLASLGYAVVAPDYLGMNSFGEPAAFMHPYLVPEPTAVACLDSMRALVDFHDQREIPVDFDTSRTVIWGASEGGFAAFWAERYAPYYAPEFDIVANVALVPPTDMLGLAAHAVTVAGSTTAGLAAMLVASSQWYGSSSDLQKVLTDQEPGYLVSNLPQEMLSSCSSFPSIESCETVEDVFQQQFIDAFDGGGTESVEPFYCYIEAATLHASSLALQAATPTLVVLSEDDDLVISPVIRADILTLCQQGYQIEHLECEGADHAEGAVLSLPYQVDWVQARLEARDLDESMLCIINDPVDCEAFLE